MKKNYKTMVMACLLTMLGLGNVSAQTIRYVKSVATGTGDGLSWANASGDIQDVINTATANDIILVAKGTYKPNRAANALTTVTATSRDNAFVIKDGVRLYGGFSGDDSQVVTTSSLQSDLTARNLVADETILSGDLNGDDVANDLSSNRTDNAYHVIIAANLSTENVFDGFTITGGYANLNANITVNTITSIHKRYGGGLYISNTTNFTVSNVISKYNYGIGDGNGGNKTGAGILIENNSNIIFNNCTIANNVSASNGYGAGASTHSSVTVVFNDSKFLNNASGYAGGAISLGNGTSTDTKFTNCTFDGNTATTRGGAIDVRGNAPIFNRCIFKNNSSPSGGAIGNFSGRPTIVNSVFKGNSTGGNGPAYGGPTTNYGAVFINCTFFQNVNTRTAASTGYSAALQIPAAAAVTATYPDNKSYIYNCIFYDNKRGDGTNATDQDIQGIAGNINVFNSITQNYAAGTNVQRGVDPQFRNTTNENDPFFLRLAQTSTGINTGDNNYITGYSIDLGGLPRIAATGSIVDLGAYESDPQTLPVNLISLNAKPSTTGVQLDWEVASETNNKQYILSRSNDGKNYSLVTKVEGTGNTTSSKNYTYTDRNVSNGTYYYKLQQEDNNGTINELGIKSVRFGWLANTLNIFPNPTKSNATVTMAPGTYTKYSVIGIQGNKVITGTIANTDTQISIDLSSVAVGTYIIKLTGATGNTATRIIKL